jgi:metal-responsive CopG/Arc/MetJ family transcriptional regulator
MNLNIYLEEELAKKLAVYSEKLNRKKNSIVREAIRDWVEKHTKKKWPKSILEFKGIKDFPSVTELRQDIDDKDEDLF